jgi:histidinol-phosphatase (PHP family)
MIIDYHMHLRGLPVDGAEPLDFSIAAVERFVEAALANGVDEIGFTEHVYYFEQTREVWDLPYQIDRCTNDLEMYCGAILEAQERGLPVKLGLEVDWVDEQQDRLAELLAPYPWDFLLGSVHWLEGLAVDAEPGVWAEWPPETVWQRYFDALERLARSGAVDVLAHPDVVKKFGHRVEPGLTARLHDHAAAVIAKAGVAFEVSTAGLRKQVGEIYPDEGFLSACRSHGVPITLASDAHTVDQVGDAFAQAIALVRRVGYETVTVLERRKARQEPLP